jgi:hypothetical protein
MSARIRKATKAIEARLVGPDQLDAVERKAIEDARRGLATLESEALASLTGSKKGNDKAS